MTKQTVVFDVDGVLVDSHDFTVECYKKAGVQMPANAFGKPWKAWLVDYFDGDYNQATNVHENKSLFYRTHAIARASMNVLPAARLARVFMMMHENFDVKFISSSSELTMKMNINVAALPWNNYGVTDACEKGTLAKNMYLASLGSTGVYIDDKFVHGIEVIRDVDFDLIHYTSQTTVELMDEIWTRLSWQRVEGHALKA